MNKTIKIGFVFGLAFFIIGCSTSASNVKAQNTKIVTVEGKKFNVPHGTNYTQEAVTPKAIDFYKSIGVKDCQYGDITWEDMTTADAINKIMRSGTKAEGIALYKKAVREGKVGCASPQS